MDQTSKNLFSILFGTRLKYVLLGIALLVFALYQLDKEVREDDDMISEQVYFLLKDGKVRSELMRGYGNLQLETQQTVFHKLFVYCGALMASVAGWSVYSLHAVSMLFLGVFFLVLYRYFRWNKDAVDRRLFWFMAVFLLLCYNIQYYANCFRPEVMMMAIGFLSYMLLERFLKRGHKAALAFSAVCAGLTFAAHPHGVIYCAAGFVLLLIRKKWLPACSFGFIAATVFAAIYFADIIYYDSFGLFWHQVSNDPIINVQQHTWYTPFLKLLEEQARILYNEREVMITLLLVTGIIFNYRFLVTRYGNLLLYGLILFITLGCYAYSKSPQYLLLYLPFTVFIIGLSWKNLEEHPGRKVRIYLYRTLLVGYAAVHLLFAGIKISKNMAGLNAPSQAEKNKMAAGLIPGPHSQLAVLAYDNFVFNEIRDFGRIQTLTLYTFFAEMQGKEKTTFAEMVAAARQAGNDYIIMNKQYLDYFELKGNLLPPPAAAYTITAHTDDLLILKLEK